MISKIFRRNFSSVLKHTLLEDRVNLSVIHGDITKEVVDVIVNNANSNLINDDGLALNISEQGGPQINAECENIMIRFGNPIPTGNVVATSGGKLPCKKVIHAVGPIYTKKGYECPLLLKRTIGNSLRLANLMKMESIAIPAICTGLYKFPTAIVSRLLFEEVLHFVHHDNKHVLKDIRLIDISEARSKIMAKEFDNRDFTQGGQRKQVLDELEGLLSDDLRVLVSDPGEGESIKEGDMVWVHYVGKLLNGTVFDSSYDRETPFEFRVGQGDVIKGWDQGIVGLKPGAHATFYCPPQFAYGDRALGEDIPANSTLIFEIEVLDAEKF